MDEPLKEMMNTTNSMKALFNDTAEQFQSATQEIATPNFVPYGSEESKSPELPVVLYDEDDEPKSEEKSEQSISSDIEDLIGESSLDDVS
jgi:hypothetical protein